MTTREVSSVVRFFVHLTSYEWFCSRVLIGGLVGKTPRPEDDAHDLVAYNPKRAQRVFLPTTTTSRVFVPGHGRNVGGISV